MCTNSLSALRTHLARYTCKGEPTHMQRSERQAWKGSFLCKENCQGQNPRRRLPQVPAAERTAHASERAGDRAGERQASRSGPGAGVCARTRPKEPSPICFMISRSCGTTENIL